MSTEKRYKKSFVLYNDYDKTLFKRLSYEQIGMVICAVIQYNRTWFMDERDTWDEADFDYQDAPLIAFDRICADIDNNNALWLHKCEVNKANRNNYKNKRDTDNGNDKDNDNDNVNDTE